MTPGRRQAITCVNAGLFIQEHNSMTLYSKSTFTETYFKMSSKNGGHFGKVVMR